MKKYIVCCMVFLVTTAVNITLAQSSPVLYFCENYDSEQGEIGISDRFTAGYLTVVVKCDKEMGLSDVHIQFDKYDHNTLSFNMYKRFDFTIKPDMKYVYFSKNDNADMSFDEPGFYRVFLLNNKDETVASALVQIIQ